MPKYSVISNNTIINCIVASSKEGAEKLTNLECREFNDDFPYDIGSVFDGTKWFTAREWKEKQEEISGE